MSEPDLGVLDHFLEVMNAELRCHAQGEGIELPDQADAVVVEWAGLSGHIWYDKRYEMHLGFICLPPALAAAAQCRSVLLLWDGDPDAASEVVLTQWTEYQP